MDRMLLPSRDVDGSGYDRRLAAARTEADADEACAADTRTLQGQSMKRYETIATNLAEQIRAGHLPVGVRLPSLRHLIAQYGVSQSTVFRAYYLLEQWGLVRAEERAGYFVTQGSTVKEKAATGLSTTPTKVDISDL